LTTKNRMVESWYKAKRKKTKRKNWIFFLDKPIP
jgi:hypothetical protein